MSCLWPGARVPLNKAIGPSRQAGNETAKATCGGWRQKCILQCDDERVVESPQYAHFSEHSPCQLRAAEYVRNALQCDLQSKAKQGRQVSMP